jgi:5'-3' exonuclease
MGIKGINKKSYINIITALDHLETLQVMVSEISPDTVEIESLKKELKVMVDKYDELITAITNHVIAYDKLFTQVKLRFIAQRLRHLKKIIPGDQETLAILKSCIFNTNAN